MRTAIVPPEAGAASLDAQRSGANHRYKKFQAVQFIKKATTTSIAAVAAGSSLLNAGRAVGGADGAFNPGKDRWSVKTSVMTIAPLSAVKPIDIKALEQMPPPNFGTSKAPFESSRIPAPVNGFLEGQTVSTVGYIHFVMYEKGDSDYHIQMNEKPTNSLGDLEPCVIVEVPHPMSAGDQELHDSFAKVRQLLREKCFAGAMPNGKVDVPIKVQVTGQLFYDLHHSSAGDPGGGRGKTLGPGFPMHATTIWEIHPVTDIKIVP